MSNFYNTIYSAKLASILILSASIGTVFGQTFYFSAPVQGAFAHTIGFQEIPISDTQSFSISGGKWNGTSWSVNFGTLNAAANYNPVTTNLQITGGVGVSPTTFSGSFLDKKNINGDVVSSTVSVNFSLNNLTNGILFFDSGVMNVPPPGSGFPAFSFPISFSGSYSLVTGGQTYNGSFTSSISVPVGVKILNASSTNLELDMFNPTPTDPVFGDLGDVTAANGVQMQLGLVDPSDGATPYAWQIPDVIAGPNPTLQVTQRGADVVLIWPGPFTLQTATIVTTNATNWSDISGATSPYTNSIGATGNQFFRLRQ